MKKIFSISLTFLFILFLSGCGSADSSSVGADTSTGDSAMLSSSSLNMDIGNVMTGLMDGDTTSTTTTSSSSSSSSDDTTPTNVLASDDDSNDSDDDTDTEVNSAPLAFEPLGSVEIMYDNRNYSMVAASSRDNVGIITPNYRPDVNGTNIVTISAYDIRSERLYPDTGSLVFSFRMGDMGMKGEYPLITTYEGESGTAVITDAYEFDNKVTLKGYVAGATFYSPSKDEFYSVDLAFDVTLYPAPAQY